jgi:hypothetical protein
MSYRDDLDAARAHVAQLERALAAAQRTIAELRREKEEIPASPRPQRRAKTPRQLGRLHYTPPHTYFPLWRLAVRGPRVIWRRLPAPARPPSNRLLVLAGRALVWPLIHLVYRPLFLAVMYLLVLPWALCVAVVGSALLLLPIVLSRVTLGPGRFPSRPSSWFEGEVTDGAVAGFLFAVVAPLPILYPFTFPLVFQE